MFSPEDSKSSKKRIGRKRLPPMPPGPSIQFVVATHPDEFRAGNTMRNVRSHVMYKHREHRGSSPSEKRKSREGSRTPGREFRTPSPRTSDLGGMLEDCNFLAPRSAKEVGAVCDGRFYDYTSHVAEDPMRRLAGRIISAITAASLGSASPSFETASYPFMGHSMLEQESMNSLKQEYINSTDFFCHGKLYSVYFTESHLHSRRSELDALRLRQSPDVPQPCWSRVCLPRPSRRAPV